MPARPRHLRSVRATRAREQELQLDAILFQRTMAEDAKPSPTENARGIPAVNALSVRVTARYASARMGTASWADVSVRETRDPWWAMRHTSPEAVLPCLSYQADGTGEAHVFTPKRIERVPKTRRIGPSEAEIARDDKEQARLALLARAGSALGID